LPVLATDGRQLFTLNRLEPCHHQDAGDERQAEILGLLDGVIDFFNQHSRLFLSEHENLRCFLPTPRQCSASNRLPKLSDDREHNASSGSRDQIADFRTFDGKKALPDQHRPC
jgi:hypothetical protein